MSAAVVAALLGATVLMLLVLVVRAPARRLVGARVAYALWALPAVRMIVPPLPADVLGRDLGGGVVAVLVTGAPGAAPGAVAAAWPVADLLLGVWLAGAAVLFAWHVAGHSRFRRRVLRSAVAVGQVDGIRVVAGDVEGPLAFGVVRRFIVVPRDFEARYGVAERELALAHERAHHARGDLVANWAALAVLAAQWWNPVAWMAVRAFREDQEFAVDAAVMAQRGAAARPDYARVLARAAGLDGLPICNLNPSSNLKGRLMMLNANPLPRRRRALGGGVLALVGAAAFAATVSVAATPAGRQAVTIGVKPDGAGGHAIIVGGVAVPAGAPLPGGATLPADFSPHGGCELRATAKPQAMVIKGSGGTTTYTVMCGSAAPAPVRATLAEGLASLKTMRASVATQPASRVFPEVERRRALGAIDRSIAEVEAALAS